MKKACHFNDLRIDIPDMFHNTFIFCGVKI